MYCSVISGICYVDFSRENRFRAFLNFVFRSITFKYKLQMCTVKARTFIEVLFFPNKYLL